MMPPVVLLHERGAVQLDAFQRSGSVLFNHDPSKIIGRPENVRVDSDHTTRADIVFDKDPFSEEVFQKVIGGSLRGVSLFFKPLDGVEIARRDSWTSEGGRVFKGPLIVITKWHPREISLTPIPADQGVGVGRSATSKGDSVMPQWLKDILVKRGLAPEDATEEQLRSAAVKYFEEHPGDEDEGIEPTTQRSDPPVEEEDEEEEGEETEEEEEEEGEGGGRTKPKKPKPVKKDKLPPPGRRSEADLREMYNLGKLSKSPKLFEGWLERGASLEEARGEVLTAMLEREPVTRRGAAHVGEPPHRKLAVGYADMLFRQASPVMNSLSINEQVRALKIPTDIPADLPFAEMVRNVLVSEGFRQCAGMSRDQLYNFSFVSKRAFQHSTSDFPELLENIANKSLVAGYNETPGTWNQWMGTLDVKDFKINTRVKMSEAEEFLPLAELTPIQESTVIDKKEEYKVSTFARRFGISREAFINDDLGGFSRIPQLFGAACARTINTRAYAFLLSNPLMKEDGLAVFHATHNNLVTGPGTVVSQTSLGVQRKNLRLQKGLAGKQILNLTPSIILAPVTQEQLILKELNASFVPTAAANGRLEWVQSLRPVFEPNLDLLPGGSTTAWYMIAANSAIDSFHVIFLQGNRTPVMTRLEGTSILGIEWVAYLDFGFAALEWRGISKNDGA